MMVGPRGLSLPYGEIAGGDASRRPRNDGSRLCRDEVQPMCGGQIKRIADQRRTRIERRVHLDLGQQLLPPSRTKNSHAALNVANVEPVAGQQKASPDGPVRLVLPDVGACGRVQTMK